MGGSRAIAHRNKPNGRLESDCSYDFYMSNVAVLVHCEKLVYIPKIVIFFELWERIPDFFGRRYS